MGNKFHQNLDLYLKGKNLSKIAKELGIPKSLLSDWVSSRRSPNLKNIEAVSKLSNYMGLTLEELLLGNGTNKASSDKIIASLLFQDQDRNYSINIKRIK